METKQTALEWLESQQEIQNMINVYSCDSQLFLRMIFNKAIAMERSQIEKSYCDGFDDGYLLANGEDTKFDDCYLYYNETYGK